MAETTTFAFNVDRFTKNPTLNETTFAVTGDGIFDKLMMTAEKHIDAQWLANRIRQEDFATIYIELYKATLQFAIQAETEAMKADLYAAQAREAEARARLADAQTQVAQAQIRLTNAQADKEAKEAEFLIPAQVESEKAQTKLHLRQAQGFQEKYKTDLLKIMLENWMVGFSVAQDAMYDEEVASKAMPDAMTALEINNVFTNFIKPDLDEGLNTKKSFFETETN